MNGLPTGLYTPGCSVLHRLQAWTKLLCLFLLLGAVICTGSPGGFLLLGALAALLLALSRLPLAHVLQPVRRLTWFFLMIFLMNLLFFHPETAWGRLWIFAPSPEGLLQGLRVVLRVLLLLLLSGLLTGTTAPLALTQGMELLLTPLGLLRLPVGQIAMILSVAIQFIPTFFEEADAIKKAQIARGAGFESRRLLDKARAVLPLVIPIFLAAFQRADELSLAMEARGYRVQTPNLRTKQPPAPADWLALGLCALLCAAAAQF